MKWFNEHLNLTYGIIIVISAAILVTTALISRSVVGPLFIIGLAVYIFLNITGGWWILRQKGQSLWFLLLIIFIYIAFIVLALALPNKRTGQGGAPKSAITDADYYNKRES